MTRHPAWSQAAVALLAVTGVIGLAGCQASPPADLSASPPAPTPSLSIPGTHRQVVTYQVAPPVSTLIVTGHVGNITVMAAKGPAVSVTEQIAYSSTRPVTTHSVKGGTLTITYSCKLQLACGVAYIVSVPRTVAVQATTTTGAIRLSGLAGPVDVKASAGLISASGLSSASASLRTSIGGINAAFTAAPATLLAASDAGGITLRVPVTVSYQVTAHTYAGKTTVTVPRSASSARTITARTNVGAVVIAPA